MGFEGISAQALLALPVLLFSIVLHEFAHAYTAYLAGDDTAAAQGRLTLNPVVHIDPFGTILVPLLLFLSRSGFIIGWAKPVPVNPLRFRSSDWDIFVSLAGPGSNFALAAIAAVVLKICVALGIVNVRELGLAGGQGHLLAAFLLYFITINILLGLFNLIPIPPLDGSRVVLRLLMSAGSPLAERYAALEQYGFIILILILISPAKILFFWVVDISTDLVLRFALF